MPRTTVVAAMTLLLLVLSCYTVFVHALLILLGFSLSGFDRIYVEPDPTGSAQLDIRNPFGARAILAVDDIEIGELLPKSNGTVRGIAAGPHRVTFELPNGFKRSIEVHAK